jgi:hypothetical protein
MLLSDAIGGTIMRSLIIAALGFLSISPALATPLIDNERVTVWDVTLSANESAPPTPAAFDTITVFLEGGTIHTKHADGRVTTAIRSFGDAVFTPKGSNAVDMSDHAHEVVIALKGGAGTPNSGPDGIPNAFPRAGSEKMFENDRVVVSRFSWTPGVAVPMHHHDKDTVMVFRYDGPIRSTGPDGKSEILDFRKDQITFSKAGRNHTELLSGERQSAVMTELK